MLRSKLFVAVCVFACVCTLIIFNEYAGALQEKYSSSTGNRLRPSNVACNKQNVSRGAIVTILTMTQEYVALVSVLGHSIRKYSDVTCAIDRIVLITQDQIVSRHTRVRLVLAGWTIRRVPAIHPPNSVNARTVKHQRFLNCFSKLHAFNMTQYRTVLFLDADTMVCGPIMLLFDTYALRMQEHGVHLAWARDSDSSTTFNSGVMLIRPSTKLATELIGNANRVAFDPSLSDQGYLTAIFNTTNATHADSIHRQYLELPQKYNLLAQIATTNSPLWHATYFRARIFHFTWLKPTARFLLLRCAYMGTLHFCRMWNNLYDTL